MAETRKLRFLISRGYNGQGVQRGSVIEVSEFWAEIFIKDGTAVEFFETPETLNTVVSGDSLMKNVVPVKKKGKK